jgi:hypothetical protein
MYYYVVKLLHISSILMALGKIETASIIKRPMKYPFSIFCVASRSMNMCIERGTIFW